MTSLIPTWIAAIAAVLGVALSWLLQQVTPFLAMRHERRRAIATVVTDLGEVYLSVSIISFIFTKFDLLMLIPPHERAKFWEAIDKFMLPEHTELRKRYSQSVTTLSSLEPVQALRLRSKDILRPLLGFMNSLAVQEPTAAEASWQLQLPLIKEADKTLREILLDLAKKHGRHTYRDIKRQLNKPIELPQEINMWIAQAAAVMKQQHGQQAQQNTPPS